MRLHVPSLTLSATEAVVTAVLEPDDRHRDPMELWWAVDRSMAGSLDLTSSPFVPVAAVISLMLGEPLVVDGTSSAVQRRGATDAVGRLAEWVEQPPITVEAAPGATDRQPEPSATGVGLFFTRGVDSWSSFLRNRSEITHLIGLDGVEPGLPDDDAATVWAEHEEAAALLGLPLVRVTTNVRTIVDPLQNWEWTHGAALASAALLLSPLLGRVLIAASYPAHLGVPWGSHPDIDPCWSTERTEIVHDGADLGRWEKTAQLAAEPALVPSLRVCWQGSTAGNCGRCEKCLRTMTTLDALGALDPSQFDGPLLPGAVRACPPPQGAKASFVEEVVAHLPPGDPMHSAWSSLLIDAGPAIRVPSGPIPMAGPGLYERVAPTLAALGWLPEPADVGAADGSGGRPNERPVQELTLGWAAGQVPLRPSAAAAHRIARRASDGDARPRPWVVAEPHDPEGVGAPEQAHLVALLTGAWGPGLTYLSGLGWEPGQPPGMGTDAVARLLATARVRAWWRHEGPLDPLRVVESLECGCLPLQVMPPGPAVSARRDLPPALSALVVTESDVRAIDPQSVGPRHDRAAATVLAGSVERDLALHVGGAPRGSAQ